MSESPIVLIVDDEEPVRAGMAVFLEDAGYRVREAASVADACTVLGADDVGLVLTDIRMPGASGLELVRFVRDHHPDTHSILVSGRGNLEDAIEAIRAGAYDYLTKPVERMEVLELAVRRALESRRLRLDERRHAAALASAHRALEEAQAHLVQSAKMAALGELVAGVAHEINNPLAFVYANVRILDDYLGDLEGLTRGLDGAPPGVREASLDEALTNIRRIVDGCRVGTERTRAIVARLRSFSRPGEGDRHEVDLHEMLEAALMLVGHRLENRIRVHRSYATLPRYPCHGSDLSQVFLNLLANAIEAIDGTGDVWLRTWIEPGGAGTTSPRAWIAVAVRDSGPGIPLPLVGRIFEPFFTTKPPAAGMGLGLFVSYGIVARHGGRLEVVQPTSGGAELRVLLPLLNPCAPNA
ncbi:MAG: response regulator [bacterium]